MSDTTLTPTMLGGNIEAPARSAATFERPQPGEAEARQRADIRTDSEKAEKIYDPVKQYAPALEGGVKSLRDEGWSDEQIETERREMTRLFKDASVPLDSAAKYHSLFVHHRKQPATTEEIKTWSRETRTWLRTQYGDEADARIKAVKGYLDTRPQLKKTLSDTGLGSNLEIVRMLAESAYTLGKPR